jgi:Ras-related C3 botulinum toxin substrate 1
MFQNYDANVMLNEHQYLHLSIWDTSGNEEFDKLRPLVYPDTDIFLVCYSTVDLSSFENVVNKWVPDIRKMCPRTPIVLVGLKKDLREDARMFASFKNGNYYPISKHMGEDVQRKLKLEGFVECSAKTQQELAYTFHVAIKCVVKSAPVLVEKKNSSKSLKLKKNKKECLVM